MALPCPREQESQVISQLIDTYDIGSKGLEHLNERCSPSSQDEGKFLLSDFNGLYILLGALIVLSLIVQYINVKFLHEPIDPFDDDFGEGRNHPLNKGVGISSFYHSNARAHTRTRTDGRTDARSMHHTCTCTCTEIASHCAAMTLLPQLYCVSPLSTASQHSCRVSPRT